MINKCWTPESRRCGKQNHIKPDLPYLFRLAYDRLWLYSKAALCIERQDNMSDYKVKDLSLADWGRKEISIAEGEM
ncbi:MAG: adenosylhomocysteinase, partial [Acetobacter fabarum]|nr:adenosylhomocysteinase [Acetobacter fabarum]